MKKNQLSALISVLFVAAPAFAQSDDGPFRATGQVTAGGIATDGLSSRTMEARNLPGLYAIGEAVDVTGWLGGYNFQWAWASGWAAAQVL